MQPRAIGAWCQQFFIDVNFIQKGGEMDGVGVGGRGELGASKRVCVSAESTQSGSVRSIERLARGKKKEQIKKNRKRGRK